MQVKTLDGNIIKWSLTGHYAHANISNKSSLHILAKALIKQKYPTLQVIEEVPVPVKKSDIYYLDFYLPMIKTAVEVHGEQHYRFIPFYHVSQLGFIKSQKRDKEKLEWCELNNIRLIELPYNETETEWAQRL